MRYLILFCFIYLLAIFVKCDATECIAPLRPTHTGRDLAMRIFWFLQVDKFALWIILLKIL